MQQLAQTRPVKGNLVPRALRVSHAEGPGDEVEWKVQKGRFHT